jgi:cell division protein FtsL
MAACAMTAVASAALIGRRVLWARRKQQNVSSRQAGSFYDNLSLSTSSNGGDSAIEALARISQDQQDDEQTANLGRV